MRTRFGAAALVVASWAAGGAAEAGVEEQEVAFHTTRDGKFEIYLRCVDGRELNLTSHAAADYGASWSPDGARLAFATRRDGDEEIYLLDLATGAAENLTRNAATDTQPAWSPDGTRLAFFSERDAPAPKDPATDPTDGRELYVVELATKAVKRITSNALYEESPSWTPDGKSLVFCRVAAGKPGCDLWMADLDGSGERQLTRRDGFNSGADVGTDGRPILFHGKEADWYEIFSVDPASGVVKQLTRDARQDWQPAWSDDGAEIVWCSGESRDGLDIWVMAADGSKARPLVTRPGRDEYPVPRPKGARGGPCAAPAIPPE